MHCKPFGMRKRFPITNSVNGEAPTLHIKLCNYFKSENVVKFYADFFSQMWLDFGNGLSMFQVIIFLYIHMYFQNISNRNLHNI